MVQHRQSSEQLLTGNRGMAMLIQARLAQTADNPDEPTPLGPFETWPQSLKTSLNILFNACSPMFLVWGCDRIFFYNDAYSSALGKGNSPTPQGQPLSGSTTADWSSDYPEVEQIFSTGQPLKGENRPLPTQQKSNINPLYTWCYSPLWDESEQVGGVLAMGYRVVAEETASDQPECTAVEKTLRQREEQLRLITDALPVLIAYVDKDHYYRFNSQTYETWFGQPITAYTGKHVRDVLGEPAYEAVRPYMEQALSGQRVGYESQIAYREGGTRYIKADYIPHLNDQGEVEGYFSLVTDISERRHVEEERNQAKVALRESKADFQAMFNLTTVGMAQADGKTRRFLQVNAAFCEITGYSEAELLALTVDDINHPDDRDRDRKLLINWLQGKTTSYQSEKRYQRKDGSIVWVLATGNVIRDEFGQPLRTIAVIQDITERKQAEEDLRKSEERFRLVTQAVNGLIFDWNLQTNEVYRSEKLYDLIGVEAENAPSDVLWWHDRTHPDDITHFEPQVAQLFASSDHFYNVEYRVRHEDGRWVDLWEQACLIRDEHGQVIRVVGCTVDISERKQVESDRKRAEVALREKEQQLRQLSDSIPQLIWLCNAAGDLEYVNRRWTKYSGLTLEQTQNTRLVAEVFHPDDVQLVFGQWSACLETQQAFEVEARLKGLDGVYRWFLIRTVPGLDDQGQLLRWYGTSTDIHERKCRELHDQFLSHLELRLRQCSDSQSMVWETISSLGQYLEVNRCMLAEIDSQQSLAIVESDWCQDAPSLAGTYSLSDFMTPEFLAAAKAGQPAIVDDITADARTAAFISNYDRLQIGSFITVSCIHQGQCVALLLVDCKASRTWHENEAELLQEAVARLWPLIEQTRAAQALREGEERLQMALEGSGGGLWDWNIVTDETYMSPRWLEMLGYEEGDLQPSSGTWSTLIHPDDAAWVMERTQAHLQDDSVPYKFEYRLLSKSGEWKWIATYAKVVKRDEQGNPLRMAGIHHDISDRKRVEADRERLLQDLATERAQFEAVLRQMPAGVIIAQAPSGQLVLGNEQAEQIWRQSFILAGEIDEYREYRGFHADGRPYQPEEWPMARSLMTGEVVTQEEIRFLRGDGTAGIMEASSTPIYNQQGQITSGVVVFQDISDRKRIEDERQQVEQNLRESERRFRRLVESNMFGVAFGNFMGGIQYANDYFLNMVGYTHEELEAGQVRWTDITPPEFLSLDEKAMAELKVRGVATPFEKEYVRKDGSRVPILIGAALLQKPYDQQQEIIAFYVDLTERKQAEAERERLLQQAQTAQEEAETANRIKDEFLAVLSHELRSPLNPILGWSRLLQTGRFDEQASQRGLQTIERNAKLQTQLIEDLLDVSRILRGKMALNICSVNLVTVVEAALETVRLAAEAKKIAIQTTFTANNIQTVGDLARLQQIVWNLLSNAVKFTPEGGQIEVRLEQIGSHAQIAVKDTGRGISPAFLPYVFDYFRQEDGKTTRKFGGLGLGLAIVRHLTELHGGTVQAESAGEGQGSTFTVRLPLIADATESGSTASAPTQASNLSQVRVLVVDDEEDMRDLAQVVLEQQGAQVTLAASAAEVLQIFDQKPPDVLVSDIGMPEVDGYMLMRQIRSRPPEQGGLVPAIALTAYAGEYDQQQALKAGFQLHIAKPVEPEELTQAIADLVRQKREQP